MSELEERLKNFSPSAKLVVTILEHHGSLTQKEIIHHSQLHGRTVRRTLEKLECAGIVEKGICIDDARQNQYRLLINVISEGAENNENND
jgi:DNA-binding MarR family transcriptional regulator